MRRFRWVGGDSTFAFNLLSASKLEGNVEFTELGVTASLALWWSFFVTPEAVIEALG